jgi:hypothetical protein
MATVKRRVESETEEEQRQRRVCEAALKSSGTIESGPDLAENARSEVRARIARRHGLSDKDRT